MGTWVEATIVKPSLGDRVNVRDEGWQLPASMKRNSTFVDPVEADAVLAMDRKVNAPGRESYLG